jgi:uncharacterized RmlC-like cupin family protein
MVEPPPNEVSTVDVATREVTTVEPPHPRVRVVHPDELSDQTGQTAGLQRWEAISARRSGARSIWMGRSVLPAGGRTGVHHHGDSETALYVLSGRGRWWIGDRLDEAAEAGPGDYVFIPPGVVHWEENASATDPVVMVVARSTQDAIVVNIPGHPHAPAHDRAPTTP